MYEHCPHPQCTKKVKKVLKNLRYYLSNSHEKVPPRLLLQSFEMIYKKKSLISDFGANGKLVYMRQPKIVIFITNFYPTVGPNYGLSRTSLR